MRMQATLDAVMIDWMLTELQNGGFTPETEAEDEICDKTITQLLTKTRQRDFFTWADRIGSVDGLDFYENPKKGDEAPLMVHHPDIGFFKINTPWYDLPEEGETLNWLEEELKNV